MPQESNADGGRTRHAVLPPTAVYDAESILKGAKPNAGPVAQTMQFAVVLNRKTAKALGLTMPTVVLCQADEASRSSIGGCASLSALACRPCLLSSSGSDPAHASAVLWHSPLRKG